MKINFCKGVSFIESEAGACIMRDATGERFDVGGAGTDFLRMIDGVNDYDSIIEQLIKEYAGVEPYVVAKDMERFLTQLVDNQLVQVEN